MVKNSDLEKNETDTEGAGKQETAHPTNLYLDSLRSFIPHILIIDHFAKYESAIRKEFSFIEPKSQNGFTSKDNTKTKANSLNAQ